MRVRMSNILENTLPIEGYKGLFIVNTVRLKPKNKKLVKDEYKAFNLEKELHFVMRTTSPKEVCRYLAPVKKVGLNVDTAITLANEERKRIIEELKQGINHKSKSSRNTIDENEVISIERLWNEYLAAGVNSKTMSEYYAKNTTYYFNKHLKPHFMGYKTRKKLFTFFVKKTDAELKESKNRELYKQVEEIRNIPLIDETTGKCIIDQKKFVDIRNIRKNDLTPIMTGLNHGSYEKKRRDPITRQAYVEYIPYKPATAHQFLKAFHPMFQYAVDEKYIESNPMDGIKAPKYKNDRNFKISKKMEGKLYERLMEYPDLKFRAIFMFLLNGRRKNEVLKLTWEDIDFETKTYYIPYYNNKNGEDYEYVLPDHLIEVLQKLSGVRKGYVFRSERTGEKIDNFDKRWNTIIKSLGLKDITRHDIRHWIGNLAINSGKTSSEVAYVLGHSDDRTVKRYAKTRKDSAAKVNDFFHEQYSKRRRLVKN